MRVRLKDVGLFLIEKQAFTKSLYVPYCNRELNYFPVKHDLLNICYTFILLFKLAQVIHWHMPWINLFASLIGLSIPWHRPYVSHSSVTSNFTVCPFFLRPREYNCVSSFGETRKVNALYKAWQVNIWILHVELNLNLLNLSD